MKELSKGKSRKYYNKQYEDTEETTNTRGDLRGLVPEAPEVVMGRPTLSEEHFVAVETALKLDCTIEEACNLAGISRAVYYKYQKKYKWFRERMQRAMDYSKVLARVAVQNQIAKGDGKLALKYLQLRDKRLSENGVAVDEEQANTTPVVQFISVATDKGQSTTNLENQNLTMQSTDSDSSVNILENGDESEENLDRDEVKTTETIWENEAEILERLNS